MNLSSLQYMLQHSSCTGHIKYFVRLLFYSPLQYTFLYTFTDLLALGCW